MKAICWLVQLLGGLLLKNGVFGVPQGTREFDGFTKLLPAQTCRKLLVSEMSEIGRRKDAEDIWR